MGRKAAKTSERTSSRPAPPSVAYSGAFSSIHNLPGTNETSAANPA